jgi:hypothetical protein
MLMTVGKLQTKKCYFYSKNEIVMDKKLLINLNRKSLFYQIVDNLSITPQWTHLAQNLNHVGQICYSVFYFLVSIPINICFYKHLIIHYFNKFLIGQKNNSNGYKYRSFCKNNHIFVLGKNRLIPQLLSGSFCPKLRLGEVNCCIIMGLLCVENFEVYTE